MEYIGAPLWYMIMCSSAPNVWADILKDYINGEILPAQLFVRQGIFDFPTTPAQTS